MTTGAPVPPAVPGDFLVPMGACVAPCGLDVGAAGLLLTWIEWCEVEGAVVPGPGRADAQAEGRRDGGGGVGVTDIDRVLVGAITDLVNGEPVEGIVEELRAGTREGGLLAGCYYDRWPCQEARFKEMAWLCNLNVNHCFGKDEVPNRMARKQVEKVFRSLAFCERRVVKLGREVDGLNRLVSAGKHDSLRTRKRRVKRRALEEKRKGYLERSGRQREELAKWEDRFESEPLYEIRTEMDHVMSVLKVLLENIQPYAHDRFFDGGPPKGMATLLRTFIDHQGDLEIVEDDGLTYRFVLNGLDNAREQEAREGGLREGQPDGASHGRWRQHRDGHREEMMSTRALTPR